MEIMKNQYQQHQRITDVDLTRVYALVTAYRSGQLTEEAKNLLTRDELAALQAILQSPQM